MSLLEIIKSVINEYNNYDYPAGADADPNAPWNQGDAPEFDTFNIKNDADNIVDFIVELHDTANGTNIVSIEKMLDATNANKDEYIYFDWVLEQNPKPVSFLKKLKNLCKTYSLSAEFKYPDQGDEYDANEY